MVWPWFGMCMGVGEEGEREVENVYRLHRPQQGMPEGCILMKD